MITKYGELTIDRSGKVTAKDFWVTDTVSSADEEILSWALIEIAKTLGTKISPKNKNVQAHKES